MRVLPKKQLNKAIKYWWVQLLNGLLLIGVGIGIVQIPDESFFSLTMLISIICLIVGLSQLFYTVTNRKELHGWGWYLSSAFIDIFFGLILIWSPLFSVEQLPFFVGLWLVLKSSNGMSLAIDLKEYGVKLWWWMILISLLIGIIALQVIAYPAVGMFGLAILTSWAYILFGLIQIGGAFHLRKLHELPQKLVNKVTNAL